MREEGAFGDFWISQREAGGEAEDVVVGDVFVSIKILEGVYLLDL